MSRIDQEDEDVEWQEWMALSDEEQETLMQREMEALQRAIDALPFAQRIAYHRREILGHIVSNRRRLRQYHPEFCAAAGMETCAERWRQGIRDGQLSLLRLRIWRATGLYPGGMQ